MKIEANEVISRSTHFSSRILVLVSGSAIFVIRYNLNSENWTFFSEVKKSLSPEQFTEVGIVVLIFALIAHIVNWWGDWVSYSRWFKTSTTTVNTLEASGRFNSEESILAALLRRLEQLEGQNFDNPEAGDLTGDRLNNLEGQIEEIQEMLKEIKPGFSIVTRTSQFVVFVWFLFVPVSISIFAIIGLYCMQA